MIPDRPRLAVFAFFTLSNSALIGALVTLVVVR